MMFTFIVDASDMEEENENSAILDLFDTRSQLRSRSRMHLSWSLTPIILNSGYFHNLNALRLSPHRLLVDHLVEYLTQAFLSTASSFGSLSIVGRSIYNLGR
jgi:hypothetical protein